MQRTFVALIAVSVVLAGVSVGPAFAAQDDTTERTLNRCGTITESGVYTLGSDLQNESADACIEVETDDVVLDGAGHTVAGDGDGTGVAVTATAETEILEPYTNVTVRNLRVTSLADGVVFVNTNATAVVNLTATDVGTGVDAGQLGYSNGADRVTVRNSTFVDVDHGVSVERSVAPTVVGNDVRNFSTHGLVLTLTKRATVADNDVERPGRGESPELFFSQRGPAIKLLNYGSYFDPVVGPNTTVADNDVAGGNLILRGRGGTSFPDTRVTNNDVEDGNIALFGGWQDDRMENTSIVGNEVTDGTVALTLTQNVTVADNRVADRSPLGGVEEGVLVSFGEHIDVTGNAVTGAETGVRVMDNSNDVRVADNRITDSEVGVRLESGASDNLVANNSIEATGAGVEVAVSFQPDSNPDATLVQGNTVTGAADGVRVVSTVRPLRIVGNDLSDTEDAVHVYEPTYCTSGAEGAELVAVHGNDLAASVYGVHNDDPDVLNATGNDWGGDGPSSADDSDASFADPLTGTLADGDGSAVSERPGDPGVSNVHFATAGRGNETAA
jgi:parallel beta-helix repeat protein